MNIFLTDYAKKTDSLGDCTVGNCVVKFSALRGIELAILGIYAYSLSCRYHPQVCTVNTRLEQAGG